MSTVYATPWGRVAVDGTVYLREGDGERAVGMTAADSTADYGRAAMQVFLTKFDDLAAEVERLGARLNSGAARASETMPRLVAIAESLPTLAAVGDVAALSQRVDEVRGLCERKAAAQVARRKAAAERITARRQALVDEAETLAASKEWKTAGDRLRALVEEWKALKGGDRAAASALWDRLTVARRGFAQRRGEYFAALETTRDAARERKDALVAEAEKLAESTDWGETTKRLKSMMVDWKAAGRAARGVDDVLWQRFRAAQDVFFARLGEQRAARESKTREATSALDALVSEAESLDPVRDLVGAEKRLRDIHDKWEKAVGAPQDGKSRGGSRDGRPGGSSFGSPGGARGARSGGTRAGSARDPLAGVPRESLAALEKRLDAVESRVRELATAARQVTLSVPDNPFVVRLRETIAKLEKKASGGDPAAEAELAAKREWLAQAESAD